MIFFIDFLLFISFISLLINLFYQFTFFIKLNYFKEAKSSFNHPISIIICSKNEANNLNNHLPKILSQNLNVFEVIVVNDQSNDDTELILSKLSKKFNNLVVVNIDNKISHLPGKKFALSLGIKSAKYEYLLLTDADCLPVTKNWASEMISQFSSYDIILGYGAYKKTKGLLNKMIRFDTFIIAQQYLSYALSGNAYMGVGRNMAYKKSLFFKNKGFASHLHIPSGDDDLFIQEVANNNVSIKTTLSSHTISEVTASWKDWIFQKRRHLTTSHLYKNKYKFLLSFYTLSNILFWFSCISLLFLNNYFIIILSFLIVKLVCSYIINYKSMKSLNVIDLYLLHPLFELIHLFIQVIFVILNFINQPIKWSR